MKNKIYYLSTCDTCKRILKDIDADKYKLQLQDTKAKALTEEEIDALKEKVGSYEALFNRRATLYKEQKLAEKTLTEKDYKALLMQHYTFLKRPIIEYKGKLFVGNDKKTVAAIKETFS